VAAGFPTTVNPILQNGAVPVFVDVDLPRTTSTPAQIEAAIGPKTKAIMLAHTLGNPFNLDVVTACARSTACGWSKTAATRWAATYRGQHGRHLWRHRHAELLPRAPHHHG
jgi:CDP-6-deoxy-D-xylo-4-hexulose-3-dehydrase